MRIEEFLKVTAERRSVRTFVRRDISDTEIGLLLEAAGWAPSNSNRQAWKFVCIKNDGVKDKIARAVERKADEIRSLLRNEELVAAFDAYAKYLTFFKDAPLVIVAMAKQAPSFLERISKNIGVPLSGGSASPEALSIAMAIQNIQLAAHVMGLGSCCMTGPLLAADEIRSILDVRPPFELTAIIPVGGYDTAAAAPERKKIMLISEIIE